MINYTYDFYCFISIECCQGSRAHYDLGLAKEMQLAQSRGDYLVLHLSELVRMAFMATTSESDPLRLEGLKTFEVIITIDIKSGKKHLTSLILFWLSEGYFWGYFLRATEGM